MSPYLLILASAIGLALGAPTAPVTHSLRFTHSDGSYEYVNTTEPDVNLDGFSEVCNTGIWMVHKNPNYHSVGMDGTVTILYQHSGCQSNLDTPLRSVRKVGIELDNTIPSLSIFSGTSMGGNMSVTIDGLVEIDYSLNSFVSIGLDNIELFEEPNYEGQSFCIDLGGVAVNWYWYLEGLDAPFDPRLAKSIKPGCGNGVVVPAKQTMGKTNV